MIERLIDIAAERWASTPPSCEGATPFRRRHALQDAADLHLR